MNPDETPGSPEDLPAPLPEAEILREGVSLSADEPYTAEPWAACEGEACPACQATGDLAGADEPDWLLAVRFLDEIRQVSPG